MSKITAEQNAEDLENYQMIQHYLKPKDNQEEKMKDLILYQEN